MSEHVRDLLGHEVASDGRTGLFQCLPTAFVKTQARTPLAR